VTVRAPNEVVRSVKRGARRLWRAVDEGLFLGPRITLSTWWRTGRHHAAPLEPLRTVQVDPQAIDRWVDMEIEEYRRIRYQFGVRDGAWDLDTVPLGEHFVYRSLEARFQRGADWSDTHLYRVALAGIENGSARYHGCRTLGDLELRLARLDDLYARIEREGYRTQAQVRRSGAGTRATRRTRPPALEEVVVHVGREGRFLLVDGVHRFSIARLQGIASIPVIVLLRHARWQARRDEIALGRYDADAAAHPDLVGLDRRR
jgi:hypothetical protein